MHHGILQTVDTQTDIRFCNLFPQLFHCFEAIEFIGIQVAYRQKQQKDKPLKANLRTLKKIFLTFFLTPFKLALLAEIIVFNQIIPVKFYHLKKLTQTI